MTTSPLDTQANQMADDIFADMPAGELPQLRQLFINQIRPLLARLHAQATQLTLAQHFASENDLLMLLVVELEELQLLDVHAICDQRDSYRAECDRLRAENAELRKDKERLDWLERKSDGSSWIVEDDGYRFALVLTRRDMSYHPDARSTARKAIDAMQTEKEKQ
jgi:hypothetical protein